MNSRFRICGTPYFSADESIHAGTQNFADPETADFENDLPHSSSVTRAALRVETPSKTMVVKRVYSLRE